MSFAAVASGEFSQAEFDEHYTDVKFPDSWRSQYYIKRAKELYSDMLLALAQLPTALRPLRERQFALAAKFTASLASSLDSLLLPVIGGEVRRHCDGRDSAAAFEQFFLNDDKSGWSDRARALRAKHGFLFELVNLVGKMTCENFIIALRRLAQDYDDIVEHTWIGRAPWRLHNVSVLAADRHNGGKMLMIVTFAVYPEGGAEPERTVRLVYKPRQVMQAQLLNEFVEALPVDPALRPRTMRSFTRVDKELKNEPYGWVEFIETKDCENLEQVKEYWTKCGVFLAIAEALFFTDGHAENIFAAGADPVLIDCETLFQVHGDGHVKITQTGLLQSAPNPVRADKAHRHHEIWSAAFQAYLFTDERQFPMIDGIVYTLANYKEDFVRGYRQARLAMIEMYPSFADEGNAQWASWWERASRLHVRHIVRGTSMYGSWMQRMLSEASSALAEGADPGWFSSREACSKQMRTLMDEDPESPTRRRPKIVESFEMDMMMVWDIPYFYWIPGEGVLRAVIPPYWKPTQVLVEDDPSALAQFTTGSCLDSIKRDLKELTPEIIDNEVALIRRLIAKVPTAADCWETSYQAQSLTEEYQKRILEFAAILDKTWEAEMSTWSEKQAPILYNGFSGVVLAYGALAVALDADHKRSEYVAKLDNFLDLSVSMFGADAEKVEPSAMVVDSMVAHAAYAYATVFSAGTKAGLDVTTLQKARKLAKGLARTVTMSFCQNDVAAELLYGNAGVILGLVPVYHMVHTNDDDDDDDDDDDKALAQHLYGLIEAATKQLLCARKPHQEGDKTYQVWFAGPAMANSMGPDKLMTHPLVGMYHGQSGIELALVRASRVLRVAGDSTLADEAVRAAGEAVRFERNHFSEDYCSWRDFRNPNEENYSPPSFCWGGNGIASARLEMLPEIQKEVCEESVHHDVGRAMQLISRNIGTDSPAILDLCCGYIGMIEALLIASLQFRWLNEDAAGDMDLPPFVSYSQGLVNELAGNFADRKLGALWQLLKKGKLETDPMAHPLSFFKGLPGIVYTVCRMFYPAHLPSVATFAEL